jgi:hypothetical protein
MAWTKKVAKGVYDRQRCLKLSSSQQFHIRVGNIKPSSHMNATTQSQEAPTLILIDSQTKLGASTHFLENLHNFREQLQL